MKDRRRGLRRDTHDRIRYRAESRFRREAERARRWWPLSWDERHASQHRLYRKDEGKYVLSRRWRNWESDWEGYGLQVKFARGLHALENEHQEWLGLRPRPCRKPPRDYSR